MGEREELGEELNALLEDYLNNSQMSERHQAAATLREALWDNKAGIIAHLRAPAQGPLDRSALTQIAAECHRAKWQFDLDEEYKVSAVEAQRKVVRAFNELHRIGDMAMKLRDGVALPSTDGKGGA